MIDLESDNRYYAVQLLGNLDFEFRLQTLAMEPSIMPNYNIGYIRKGGIQPEMVRKPLNDSSGWGDNGHTRIPALQKSLEEKEKAPWVSKFFIIPQSLRREPFEVQLRFALGVRISFMEIINAIIPNALLDWRGRFGIRTFRNGQIVDSESYPFSDDVICVKDSCGLTSDARAVSVTFDLSKYNNILKVGAEPGRVGEKRVFVHVDSLTLYWRNGNTLISSSVLGDSSVSFLRKLFLWDDSKDVTIVAGNGAELKCHQLIFQGRSPVFMAMMDSSRGMMEAKMKRVDLSEFSEDAVQCLIHYFYSTDIFTEEISPNLGLELLHLAHRYHLKELQDATAAFIMSQKPEWLTADAILEIYFFVRNVKELETLKVFLLEKMESLREDIRSCDKYKELTHPESDQLLWEIVEFLKPNKRARLD